MEQVKEVEVETVEEETEATQRGGQEGATHPTIDTGLQAGARTPAESEETPTPQAAGGAPRRGDQTPACAMILKEDESEDDIEPTQSIKANVIGSNSRSVLETRNYRDCHKHAEG